MSKSKENALFELNTRRETWCRLDIIGTSPARAENRHFDCHLRSTWDFKSLQAVAPEQRSAWTAGHVTKYPERKHFEESHKVHLV
ncbi:hypothetical protein DPEC_G00085430 [Dallia pectoralis]|uniref:Uncharacterized protein n=1 Tax=Dallia pectoralis TaxID=75939 RepID=A0ACC2GZQ9_DALPE|nr:hypothetical protein DPEC_G00085430 [Dallia pectoralis]